MASLPIPADTEKSVRRSRARYKVLMMLASMGEAYVGQLARAAALQPTRVKAVLHGDGRGYKVSLSLVEMGLAERVQTPNGRVYRITSRGLRKARSLAKRARAGRDALDHRADAVASG